MSKRQYPRRLGRKTIKRHPEKERARSAVSHAIKHGRLRRPEICPNCGEPAGVDAIGRSLMQAHHADYSRPLEVEWLCQKCHIYGETHEQRPEKLTLEIAQEIRQLQRDLNIPKRRFCRDMAPHFNVSAGTMRDVLQGRIWNAA